jgi:hypothetical protein
VRDPWLPIAAGAVARVASPVPSCRRGAMSAARRHSGSFVRLGERLAPSASSERSSKSSFTPAPRAHAARKRM